MPTEDAQGDGALLWGIRAVCGVEGNPPAPALPREGNRQRPVARPAPENVAVAQPVEHQLTAAVSPNILPRSMAKPFEWKFTRENLERLSPNMPTAASGCVTPTKIRERTSEAVYLVSWDLCS